jgi:surfeit locus 1 family protein
LSTAPPQRRARWPLVLAALACCALFTALGAWQLQRRLWKLELIARVDARLQAAPLPLPGPADWARFDAAGEAYRRVLARGHFLAGRDTLVQASTELGSGHWLLAPFELAGGGIVLVNRGFVPPHWHESASSSAAAAREQALTGLLRATEPGGTLLRRNDPAADRWTSRDVVQIARRRGLDMVAPFFVDAQAAADAPAPGEGEPVPGLTVVTFRNDHLVYALTWFALAAMSAVAARRLASDPAGTPQGAP